MGEKKKKVLFVATVDSHIELFHVPYLKMFHDKGWEVHVATDTDKKIPFCDKKICLPIKRSPFKFLSNFKAVRKLKKIAQEEGYNIVHCHTPMGSVVTRLACKKARRNGTRVIYTAHGFHFYTGAPMHFWLMFYPVEWYLAKFTDTLITINNEDFERAKAKFGKRCRDIQYVPGVGVDPKKFEKKMSAKEKLALRDKLGLGADDKVLIFPAELSKRKNQMWLIKTLEPLFKEDKKYHLLLPGKDSLNGKCQQLAKDLGLESQIHFLGFRNDIPELMQISDVAVSSAKQEGLPVNLIEAAMLGLPIVATDCRGNRDVCEKAGGVIARQGDDGAFLNGVAKVLKKGFRTKIMSELWLSNIVDVMSKIYFRKKRILHVLASNIFSGAENVACTIIRNLSDEFDMAYCSPQGPIEKKLKEMGIKYFGIDKLNHGNLKNVIKEFNPDIIHAHDFRASMMAVRFNEKVIVSQLHKNDPGMRRVSLKSVLYYFGARKFSRIVGVSDVILDECFYGKSIKEKYITIPNYVDKEEILRKASEFEVGKKYDLFFFGRLSDEKNPQDFIRIVNRIKGEGLKCVMIGDGPLYDDCKEQIKKSGLEKTIDMIGFQSNPYPYVLASKTGVMPSKYEGYGISAIEATVLNKPVINSGAGGLKAIFVNTNLVANCLDDYIDIYRSKDFRMPIIDGYCNYDDWRRLIISTYSAKLSGGRL